MACYYTDSNQPPKKINWVLVAAIVGLILFWMHVASCSAYHAIRTNGGKPPETTQDSTNLSGRCVATFPQKLPIIKPSKPIISVITKKDTTQSKKLQKTIDSLLDVNAVLFGLMDSVKIVNVDSLKQAIRNSIVNDCNPFEDDSTYVIHDTLPIYADSAMVFNLRSTNALKDVTIEKLTTQLSDTTSDKNKYFWLLIIAAIGLGVGGYLAVKNKI